MTFAVSAAMFLTGVTLGWMARAFMATLPKTLSVPHWAQRIEEGVFVLMLGSYSRYTRWQLARRFKAIASTYMCRPNRTFDNEDPTKPWAMNEYLQLLPWTAKYHQSNGVIVEGTCATQALTDILWDMGKDNDGFVSVDYRVDSEPETTYRLALTQNVSFNNKSHSWPFNYNGNTEDGEGDADGDITMDGTGEPHRPALIQAIFTSKPGWLMESDFDVTQFFVALDGPMNSFSDMEDIPISRLLLETVVPEEEIDGGTIKLATVRGAVTLPVETSIREAHIRLCVVGE